jgi:transcriptional regulator of heat shock response
MKERQNKILKALIKEYQKTGMPVSSQAIIEKNKFGFSPATVRAEMMELDRQGYLEQPHTSAGRVPTDKALRSFVDELESEASKLQERDCLWEKIEELHRQSLKEMAQFLADSTRNFGFSGFFGSGADFHAAGLKWLLDDPDFEDNELKSIIKYFDSMENDFNEFFGDMDEEVEIFIGQENPIKYLRQCSLVITGVQKKEEKGVLGILGPKRMNYQRNKFIVGETRKKIKNLK